MNYNRIEERRKLLRLTQEELAKKANLSRVGYQKIIKKQSSTVETLELLTKALGVTISYWWEDMEISQDKDFIYPDGKMCNEIIQDLLDDKKRMKSRIDELERRLKVYEPKKKEGVSE